MKRIQIKSLRLVNFKGVRSLSIEMNSKKTEVFGANGSGKTTIFDAFTWLLFGKDSRDRKQFEIKTLDADGKPIQRLPHEVVGELLVDGELVSLTRRFCEKWVKPRGQAEEVFAGHEEERLYNDVPCSLKEWNEKIAAICGEQVFKFITSPSYFVSQKPDVQRAMLFRMAGNISDNEIAAGNADFTALLANLTGKSMDEYKREIQAKKRRLKAEIDTIPERIDERRRDTPQATDFAALETELQAKQSALAEIEARLTDIAKLMREANDEKLRQSRKVGELKQKRTALEYEIKEAAMAEYRKGQNDRISLEADAQRVGRSIKSIKDNVLSWEKDLAKYNEQREALRAEWKRINATSITFSDEDFKCPTCGRRLEVSDIEAKQAAMTENFNKRKAESLSDNVVRGKSCKQRIEELVGYISDGEGQLDKYAKKLEELQYKLSILPTNEMPDTAPIIAQNGEYKALAQEIDRAEKEASEPVRLPSTDELTEGRQTLTASIDELKAMLAQKEVIARNEERIKELTEQLRTQSEELARLEGVEFTMAAFAKAKIEAVEAKINGLFSLVRFKMYDQQINGGEVETCEATVGGVPYSSLNNAGQINAGIDIINAICRYDGVCAPIFVDNAEAVNTLTPTSSQLIRLVVTEDKSLIIH